MIPDRVSDAAPIRLLIAEDEQHLGAILEHFLSGRGYDVTMCRDGRTALESLHTTPFDVALLDIVMPEMDGLEVLRHLQSEEEPPEVIIITGNGTIDTAINAIKLGAYDYISKPYRMAEIDVMVRRAWEKRELGKANAMLRSMLRARSAAPARAITSDNADMREALQSLSSVATDRGAIAIVGERGSGKSHAARHVHGLSGRARDAFIEVTSRDGRLATVGDLFGHQGRAAGVVGAAGSGALLLAERGTVAVDLDRIDREAADALSRAVSAGFFVRVGGSKKIPLIARVIVCTCNAAGAAGFPAGVTVSIPPLRERTEDIQQLATELLSEIDGGMCTVAADGLAALRSYAWPGNVRELEAVLTRASLLARSERLGDGEVRMSLATGSLGQAGHGGALDELERMHIENTLVQCNWHQGRAAMTLGISTKTLYRKMREYGFRRPRKRKLARLRLET